MGQKLPEPHFTDRRKSLSPSPNTTFFTPSSNFVTWLHLPSGLRTKCAYLRVSEMHRQSKAEHDGQVKDSSSRSIRKVIHETHSRRSILALLFWETDLCAAPECARGKNEDFRLPNHCADHLFRSRIRNQSVNASSP